MTNPLAPSAVFLADLRARRDRFFAMLGDDVAVLSSTPVFTRNNDVEHPYRQDSDLFYLTGYDEPDVVAVFAPGEKERFVLFVRLRDRERETWDGPRSGIEGAVRDFGADVAYPIAELEQRLPKLLENRRRLHYALGRDPAMDQKVLAARDLTRRRQRFGVLAPSSIVDLTETVQQLRAIKTDYELALMRRAATASLEGHVRAMEVALPGVYEYEVEAALIHSFRRHGCARPAYEPIVGSGPNATILHYRKNDRRLASGDLLLIDAGGELDYYASDVTRTFPVSGRFTTEQRAIYELVLRAEESTIALVKPGVTLDELHDHTVRVLTEGLVALGLIEGPVDAAIEAHRYKAFYMHRTSHWLGMDVHDVGGYLDAGDESRPRPTQRKMAAGMVLTVEPGIYIAENADVPAGYRGIGIRIEDDVLVTATGHEVITAAIPKQPDEVEAILAKRVATPHVSVLPITL